MTTALARTVFLQGVEALPVNVQVQVRPGLASFQVVGLPDGAVREARERVQAAFHSAGFALPAKRVVVNLSPADVPKQGAHYDLPIAVGLLVALGFAPPQITENTLFMGELALDGTLVATSGVLPAAIFAAQNGVGSFFLPAANAPEGAAMGGIAVYGVNTLKELADHFQGQTSLKVYAAPQRQNLKPPAVPDFADVKGQQAARRAAEIAAAGRHHLLMCGPPGSGKSMVARRLAGLLPPLTTAEAVEVSLVHSVAGGLLGGQLVYQRPFREPHHSASAVALVGGGHRARPGEISLAHKGVLFLDELPEFPRHALETLRQPLEAGYISVARANYHLRYPAQFQLIAAMNPCPCGYKGHHSKVCTDTPAQVQKYQARLSGPLLDRFDLFVDVRAIPTVDLAKTAGGENTATMAERVARAHQLQKQRHNNEEVGVVYNAQLEGQALMRVATPEAGGQTLLDKAAEKYALSARGYHRILKVARTIADLEGAEAVQKHHVAEALLFRQMPEGFV